MKKTRITELVLMALLVAILCVSAMITIPVPFSPVPYTAQTLVIALTGMLLTPTEGCTVVIVYILLGVCGLPVFAGLGTGPGAILGPTGGYILSWLITVPVISLLKGRRYIMVRYCMAAVAGMSVSYVIGSLYVMWQTKISPVAALVTGVVPYIVPDLIKVILAAVIVRSIGKAVGR